PSIPIFGGVLNLAATMAVYGSSSRSITLANVRIRDQSIFRALARRHLPRIIVRDYLLTPYIILTSVAISLCLIFLIVLLGSSFLEEVIGCGHGYHSGSGSRGAEEVGQDGLNGAPMTNSNSSSAKYPFRALEIGELGFKTGDQILVVDQSDDIW
ncbi:hypothetical protein BGZ81_003883, partial [Podila clonocystis]